MVFLRVSLGAPRERFPKTQTQSKSPVSKRIERQSGVIATVVAVEQILELANRL